MLPLSEQNISLFSILFWRVMNWRPFRYAEEFGDGEQLLVMDIFSYFHAKETWRYSPVNCRGVLNMVTLSTVDEGTVVSVGKQSMALLVSKGFACSQWCKSHIPIPRVFPHPSCMNGPHTVILMTTITVVASVSNMGTDVSRAIHYPKECHIQSGGIS